MIINHLVEDDVRIHKSFGWNTAVIDGHDPKQIEATLLSFRDGNNQKPLAVIANTIKGKGISFMEEHGPWHYKIPNEDEHKMKISNLVYIWS